MTIAAAIVARLAAVTAVTELVGTRIYSVSAPDGETSPHVIFQHIGTDPGASHGEAAGANQEMYQFACFAGTPKAARALRDAVVAALDSVRIGSGDSPTLEDTRDGDVDDAAKLFRADADFVI